MAKLFAARPRSRSRSRRFGSTGAASATKPSCDELLLTGRPVICDGEGIQEIPGIVIDRGGGGGDPEPPAGIRS